MLTSRRSSQGMDSDDSQDGSRKARSSSSSSSSSRSSERSPKAKNEDRNYGPRSPSPPGGPASPDNPNSDMSPRGSEIRSPVNSRPGPKTPESPASVNASRASSRAQNSPLSSSSPTLDSPKGPRSLHSGNSSPSSPVNRSRRNWSPRSDSRSRKSRSGSANSDESRPGQIQPRTPVSRNSRSRSSSSSHSSNDSAPLKRRQPVKAPATEEVSEGEMESDNEGRNRSGPRSPSEEKKPAAVDLNISHEDLSDVSDLDSGGPTFDDDRTPKSPDAPPAIEKGPIGSPSEVKVNGSITSLTPASPPLTNGSISDSQKIDKFPQEKTSRTEDSEEQLDFEAEEGECLDPPETTRTSNGDQEKAVKTDDAKEEGAIKSDSELEEGEVSDEGERRPEEVEPRPICRFYSRGQCTWGINCRFLHPGVTDKGNYTMFDMVRAMPGVGHPMMHGRPPPPHMQHPLYREIHPMAPPPSESAWERGLKTAKEMLRLASKRREQEGADFEDKRLHLSAAATGVISSTEDPDALYVSSAAVGASPPQRAASPAAPATYHGQHFREPEYYGRPAPYDERYALMRGGRPREAPPHRAPPFFDERERYDDRLRYDDRQRFEDRTRFEERASPAEEATGKVSKRRPRTNREVILQRAPSAEKERERGPPTSAGGRGDEWADPWMRGGGTAATAARNRHKRSASSHTSYSTSSSSRSSSRSSRSSRGRTTKKKRSEPKPRRPALSPSVIVKERRAAVARATAMNPPAPSPHRRRAPSPAAERALQATNPPPPVMVTKRKVAEAYGRTKPSKPAQRAKKRYSQSSSSGSDSSSTSSESESESHSSSSSRSSSEDRRKRNSNKTAPKRAPPVGIAAAASRVPPKAFSASSQSKKENAEAKDASSKKRGATSPINNAPPPKKPVSRREELLKQLKAVEDAIARKRSKI